MDLGTGDGGFGGLGSRIQRFEPRFQGCFFVVVWAGARLRAHFSWVAWNWALGRFRI